jgi:hypothetical protein
LTGHERVIVTHRLNGQDHVHVAWNRMSTEKENAAELHFYKHKCTDTARELEKAAAAAGDASGFAGLASPDAQPAQTTAINALRIIGPDARCGPFVHENMVPLSPPLAG